ncbi:GNAT family N-acetyltransferase [Marinobacter fonticola]|uniref:GNAT family N-acetyltransferase n=1 Tax=Marinobacter fonticola TaxID=2603215 RepID=UPI0019310196|nr:GNAT family N-acetyltransferase [Marinobacter fonticola]
MLISEAVELQLLSKNHADDLFRLVDTNREHLREWLPWVDANQSPADTESFVNSAISQRESGKGPQYAVFHKATLCGVCGFHSFDVTNKIGGIGYWLSRAYSGKGIITLSVKALIETGFREYGLNRIEIACATDNGRSRALPERLGFTFEGVLREREYLYGRYVDHALYSMLASEFSLKKALHRT